MIRQSINIQIISNNPNNSNGFRQFLGNDEMFDYCFVENSYDSITIKDENFQPDCILLDFAQSSADNLELLTKTVSALSEPAVSIIFVIDEESVGFVPPALKNRVQGYLIRNRFSAEILRASVHHAFELTGLRRRQKQNEEILNRYCLLAEHSRDMMLFFRADGEIVEANQAALDAFAYTREEILTKTFDDLRVVETWAEINEKMRFAAQNAWSSETIYRRRDGSQFPAESDWSFTEINGQPVILSIMRDISERKNRENELRESRHFIENIVEVVPSIVYLFDINSYCNTYLTSHGANFLGYSPEEIKNAGPYFLDNFMHPDDTQRVRKHFNLLRHTKNGEIYEFEYRMRHKSGEWRWFKSRDRVFRSDEHGQPREILGIAFDITENKKAAQALLESNQRYQTLAEISPYAIFVNLNDKIVYVNQECVNLFGAKSPDEIIGQSPFDFIHPDFHEIARERIKLMKETPQTVPAVEEKIIRPDGKVVDVEISASTFIEKGEQAILVALRDIGERKETETKLRESEERFHQIANSLPQLVWTCLSDGRCDFLSRQWVEYTGIPEKEQLDFGWLEQIHPADREPTMEAWKKAVESGSTFETEFRIRRHDGVYRLFDTRAIRLFDDKGGIVKWFGSNTDITDRKEAEENLRASEAVLQLGVEVADFVICHIDYKKGITHLSKEAAKLYGFGSEALSLPREKVHAAFHPEDASKLAKLIEQALMPESGGWFVCEHRIVRKNGEIRWLNVRKQIFFDHSPNPPQPSIGILAAQDITERKQADEQLRASEEFNRTVLENSPDCVKILDAQGRLQFMNTNGLCLMEIDDFAAFKNEPWWKLWPEETQPSVKDAVKKALQGETSQFQAFCPTAEGTPKWWDVIVAPVVGRNGKTEQIISVSRDITENKKAQAELERYRLLAEKARDIVWIARPDGKIIEVNQAAVDTYGYSREELLTMNISDLREPSTLPSLSEQLKKAAGSGITFETLHVRQGGSTFPVEVNANGADVGGERLIMAIVRDVTERKQAEKALLDANRRITNIFESITDCFYSLDSKFRFTFVNPQAEAYFGIPRAEILGRTFPEVLPKTAKHEVWQKHQEALREQQTVHLEFMSPTTGKWVDLAIYPSEDGLSVYFRDITERKEAEEKLQEEKRFSQNIIEAAPTLTYIYDLKAQSNVFISPLAVDILGYTPEELQEMGADLSFLLIHPDDKPRTKERFEQFLADTTDEIIEIEYRMRRKDRNYVWLNDRARVFSRDEFGRPARILGVATDITLRKAAEEARQQFVSLIEETSDFVGMAKLSSEIIYTNPAGCKLVGIDSQAELYGTRIPDYHPPATAKMLQEIAIPQVLETGSWEGESQFVHFKTGEIIDVYQKVFQIRNPKTDELICLATTATDITERKRAEEKIRESEERFRRILKQSPAGIVQTDAQGNMILVNERWCEMLGYSEAEMLTMSVFDVTHPSSLTATIEAIERIVKGGPDFQIEKNYRRKDGSMIRANSNVTALRDAEGNFQGVVAVVLDISERLKAEEQIRQSEEIFRIASDAATAQVYKADLTGKSNTIAYGLERVTGYSNDEISLNGDWWHSLIHPDDLPSHLENLERQLKSGHTYKATHRLRRKTGEWIWVEDTGQIIRDENGQAVQLVGAVVDITSRKEAEDKIRESEERFRLASDAAAALVYDVDLTGKRGVIVHGLERVAGYRNDESDLSSDWWHTLIHPDDLPAHQENFAKQLTGGGNRSTIYRVRHKNGEWIWVEDTAKVVFDQTGTPVQFVGTIVDITARQEAEERLRYQLQLTQNITETAAVSIFVSDAAGCVTFLNPEAEKVFGWTLAELKGKNLHDTIHYQRPDGSPYPMSECPLGRAYRGGEAVREFEDEFYRKDGQPVTVICSNVPILENGTVTGVVLTVQDITERKHAEEKIRESEERLNLALKGADLGTWDWNINTGDVIFNERSAEIVGYTLEEINPKNRTWNTLVHPEDQAQVNELIIAHLAGKTPFYESVHRIRTKSGDYKWILDRGRVFQRDADGKPLRMAGTYLDITQPKIEELNQKLLFRLGEIIRQGDDVEPIFGEVARLLGERLGVARCLFNEIDLVNQTANVRREFRREDLPSVIGARSLKNYSEKTGVEVEQGRTVIIKDTRTDERTADWYKKTYQPEQIGAYIIVPLMRGREWVATLWVSETEPREWQDWEIALIETVGERSWLAAEKLRSEKQVRESEKFVRSTLNSLAPSVAILNYDGVILDVNREWRRFAKANDFKLPHFGVGLNYLDVVRQAVAVGDSDAKPILKGLEAVLSGRKSKFEYEYPCHSLHHKRWFILNASPLDTAQGGAVVSHINITDRKLAEEQIQTANYRFRIAEEAAKGFNYEWNLQTRQVTRSETLARVIGYQREELEADWDSWVNLIHPDDKLFTGEAEAIKYLNKLKEETFSGEYRIRHKNGHYIWVMERGLVVRDENGKPVRVIGQTMDITERKESEEKLLEAERRAVRDYRQLLSRIAPLAQTLGTALDLVTIYRALSNFVRLEMPCHGFFVSFYDEASDTRTAAYGWADTEGEIEVSALPPIPLTGAVGPNARAVHEGQTIVCDNFQKILGQMARAVVVGEDDGSRPNSSIASPMIVMNRVVGTLEVQTYQTKAFNREHTIALEMAANLAAVAIENVRLINIESEARAAAEEANRAKDEFLAILSHELRAPLNSMYGWTQILQTTQLEPEQTQKAIEVIARNIRLQNTLIEDILDASRIISGKMRIEPETMSLAATVQSAIEMARPVAERQGVEITFAFDTEADQIFGDKHRLQQVMGNLLTNAIKFTPRGGSIQVILSKEGERAKVIFRDTGIGIEPHLLPHIFDRFKQADGSSRRKYGGLGLGLTIVKHLVELHGGEVTAHSEGINQGTTITIFLPLISTGFSTADFRSARTGTENDSANNKPLNNLRILLVDDDADALQMMRFIIESEGAKAVCVNSAESALSQLEQPDFDLLISDLGMAQVDGYDLIRTIRQSENEKIRRIPAIALTGYVSTDDRERVLSAGFQKHLAKPVDVENLTATVLKVLQSKG